MLSTNTISSDLDDIISSTTELPSVISSSSDDSNHTVQFESPTHTTVLLNGLNSLRNKKLLVDITLVAGGQAFEAHRVVLSACSDYFRVMFTTDVKESKQKVVTLEGVSALGIHYLLDYAYTSRLTLNLANIQDILSAASHVQLTNVVEACSNYLQDQLDIENCVDIACVAETYSLVQLKKRVYKFMSGHLTGFSQSPDFQRLSFEQIEYLLDCDYPVDCPESDVLQILLQWINYDENRVAVSSLLLTKIHYDKIAPDILKIIWDHSILPISSSECPNLYKMIMNQLFPSDPISARKAVAGSLNGNSRGMALGIIKVGGFGVSGVTNEITYYLPSVGRWKRLTTIPHVDQSNFAIAVLNNLLYVVGGCFNQYLQENIHPFGFCYNPKFDKWETIQPMLMERCRFTLNAVGDKLIAVGGASESMEDLQNPEEFCPCESYDPELDAWKSIASLPHARTQHAGASWNTILFISGGLEQDIVSNSLMCYNIVNDEWEVKSPMLSARADHSMITYKDKLYVCGGWFEDESIGNRLLVSTIEEYDIHSNTWRVIAEIPTPRFHAGVCLVHDKFLMIIGGFNSEATFDRTTGVIECFDLNEFKWLDNSERYPEDIWEHCNATLFIPASRNWEDMDVISEIR